MNEKPILFKPDMVRAILAGQKTQTRRIVKVPITYAQCDADYEKIKNTKVKKILTGREYSYKQGQPYSSYHYDKSVRRYSLKEIAKNFCPYGKVGDQLWVKETFREWHEVDSDVCGCSDHCDCRRNPPTPYCYRADGYEIDEDMRDYGIKWKPSIFMPREASRIDLLIKDVRIERLHDISEEDAIAEGCKESREISPARDMGDGITGQLTSYASAAGNFQILWCEIHGYDSWDENPWLWVIEFEHIKEKKNAENY